VPQHGIQLKSEPSVKLKLFEYALHSLLDVGCSCLTHSKKFAHFHPAGLLPCASCCLAPLQVLRRDGSWTQVHDCNLLHNFSRPTGVRTSIHWRGLAKAAPNGSRLLLREGRVFSVVPMLFYVLEPLFRVPERVGSLASPAWRDDALRWLPGTFQDTMRAACH
jgi:hypothetical protein